MLGSALTSATRKKQQVASSSIVLPAAYKPRGATRAQQQQGASVDGASVARIEMPRRAAKQAEQEQIEISAPGCGYVAVKCGERDPQLFRVARMLRGATRARETHGAPSNSPSEGVSVPRAQSVVDAHGRRRVATSSEQPEWNKRGLFKAGFNIAPRLKSAKLFTKGKER